MVAYSEGNRVVVQEGVLAGVQGVVQQRRSRWRLPIWVREIGGGVAFTVGSAAVALVSTPGPLHFYARN